MKYLLLILFAVNLYSVDLDKKEKLFAYALSLEGAQSESLENYNGFLNNTKGILQKLDYLDFCNLEPIVGTVHNILIQTLYHCDAEASRAITFNEAVSAKNTPDSIHYALLMHDALLYRGIYSTFFSINDLFYGIVISCKNSKFYWSILNPIAGHTTQSISNLLRIYRKYQKIEIDSNKTNAFQDSYDEISQPQMIVKIQEIVNEHKFQKEIKPSTYNIKQKYRDIVKIEKAKKDKINLDKKEAESTQEENIVSTKNNMTTSDVKTKTFTENNRHFKLRSKTKLDLSNLSTEINNKFYKKTLYNKLKECVSKADIHNRWFKLSYTILSEGTLSDIVVKSGNMNTKELNTCFEKELSGLVYTGLIENIIATHYLYF